MLKLFKLIFESFEVRNRDLYLVVPSWSQKRPLSHAFLRPFSQNSPSGHGPPTILLSDGLATVDFEVQKNPSAQG